MIYTIGRTEVYEKLFVSTPGVKKLGRDMNYKGCPDYPDGYPGGCVWETREKAQQYCPGDYSVYGVQADWIKDTDLGPDPKGTERSLLIDSFLIKLEEYAYLRNIYDNI